MSEPESFSQGAVQRTTAPSRYTRWQIILHWSIAVLVAFQIFFHGHIEALWDARMSGTVPNEASPNAHALVGIVILVLMLGRVLLGIRRDVSPGPTVEHPVLRLLARSIHGAFYVLLLEMPLVGAWAWFGGAKLPAQIHVGSAIGLIVLILIHSAAVVAHQLFFKTNVLRRMMIG